MDKRDIILILVLFYFVFFGLKLSKRYEDPSRQHDEGNFKNDSRYSSQWSAWSEWTRCSVTCGLGRTLRRRECIHKLTQSLLNPAFCGHSDFIEEAPCKLVICPNDKATKDHHPYNENQDNGAEENDEFMSDEEHEWKRRHHWQQEEERDGRSGTDSEGPLPLVDDLTQGEDMDSEGGMDNQEDHEDPENWAADHEGEGGTDYEEADHKGEGGTDYKKADHEGEEATDYEEADHEGEGGTDYDNQEAYDTVEEGGSDYDQQEEYDTVEEAEEEQDDREEELVRKKKKKKKRKSPKKQHISQDPDTITQETKKVTQNKTIVKKRVQYNK